MTEKQVTEWLLIAGAFQGISQLPEDARFWRGYQCGLQRRFHGEETEEDREKGAADDPDPLRRAEEEGYRAGLQAAEPVALFKAGQQYLTGPQLAAATGVGTSRIRQLARTIPGGRQSKHGWQFPPSAVAYINARPKPGDHSRGVKRKKKKGEAPGGP